MESPDSHDSAAIPNTVLPSDNAHTQSPTDNAQTQSPPDNVHTQNPPDNAHETPESDEHSYKRNNLSMNGHKISLEGFYDDTRHLPILTGTAIYTRQGDDFTLHSLELYSFQKVEIRGQAAECKYRLYFKNTQIKMIPK